MARSGGQRRRRQRIPRPASRKSRAEAAAIEFRSPSPTMVGGICSWQLSGAYGITPYRYAANGAPP